METDNEIGQNSGKVGIMQITIFWENVFASFNGNFARVPLHFINENFNNFINFAAKSLKKVT